MAGRFFLRFCLPFLSRHLPSPRYRRKRKSAEINSAQIKKKRLCKKPLGRYGRKIVKGEASSRPVCRSQSAAPVIRGIAHPSDPSPGGSQDTGGAFRSRVQRHGVRGCSHEQRSKTSIPQRTDLAQVKRDRHTGKPRKTSKPKTTRRGKNEGSVYRRKDGKWVGQVTVGYHPDTGKPIRKYTYASTREEAAHWIALTLVSETSKAVSLRWHPNCC